MRRFWLFRSDIKALEYYHKFKDLKSFEENCHDFYLLQGLWLLRNDHFDEVVIWRITDSPRDDIIFDVNGKKFIQRWVKNLRKTFDYEKPEISFWRGGFAIYDQVTSQNPKHFGLKLYLGAGRRITPQWGGKYDYLLMEDERDFVKKQKCIPFYKTASPNIFKPLDLLPKYDICWPCNFTQLKYKGQDLFLSAVGKIKPLSELKIVHCGNHPHIGKKLCLKYGVKNVEFMGPVDRKKLNSLLNKSKYGLNLSNLLDGCPRVSTEILMSGTPLFLRDKTRLLNYFRRIGVLELNERNLVHRIVENLHLYDKHKIQLLDAIEKELSFDTICAKNLELWRGGGE